MVLRPAPETKFMTPGRERLFHYAIAAKKAINGAVPVDGFSEAPANDFVLGMLNLQSSNMSLEEKINAQATVFMHEFGHNLGLYHGGNQIEEQYKINYFSIMSLQYSLARGLRRDGVDHILDYSRLKVAAINEQGIYEENGLSPIYPTTEEDLDRYGVRYGVDISRDGDAGYWIGGTASENTDFNNDNNVNYYSINISLNGDRDANDVIRASQNDWDNLYYGGTPGEFGDHLLSYTHQNRQFRIDTTAQPCPSPVKIQIIELDDALDPGM